MILATAAGVTAALRVCEAAIPSAGGWPVCTPLNGVVLAVLLMTRRKLWLWILVGYVAALSAGQMATIHGGRLGPWPTAGCVAELLIAALTLPPFRNLKLWLLERRLFSAFFGYALLLGPAVMSLAARHYTGGLGAVVAAPAGLWRRAGVIWPAEALGIALVTPLVLVLSDRKTYELFRLKALPATSGLFGLLSLVTWVAFAQSLSPLVLLTYGVLVLIAFRLGFRGAVLATAVAAAIVMASTPGTVTRASQMAWGGQGIVIQSCLALAVLLVLPLSVVLVRRQDLEERLSESEAQLDRLKSLDRITGVPNRKRFDLVLAREWQRALRDPKPGALLMIDTDYFAEYNELYGHQAGDDCLRLIAARLADQRHRAYDLVSRYDGGQFSVLLPGASGDAVKRIAEEFRAEIAALEWPHERSAFECVTVSVGWASMMPNDNSQPEFLIAAAEQALSSAKTKGRNRVEGFTSSVAELTPA